MINHWVPIVDDDVGALRMWSVMLLDILVGCETHFYYYFFFFFFSVIDSLLLMMCIIVFFFYE